MSTTVVVQQAAYSGMPTGSGYQTPHPPAGSVLLQAPPPGYPQQFYSQAPSQRFYEHPDQQQQGYQNSYHHASAPPSALPGPAVTMVDMPAQLMNWATAPGTAHTTSSHAAASAPLLDQDPMTYK